MKHRRIEILRTGMLVLSAVLFAALVWVLWRTIPWSAVRYGILGLCAAIFAVVGLWAWYQRRQVSLFADDLCETLDALLSGRQPENYQPYEDSLTAKVQGKLMQYFDIMSEGKRQSQQDKQVIQSLVSDISHQVKTPIANIKMFTNILQQHQLPPEKQAEFLCTMEGQIDKLDFLMQSLIKMSRLETGTFVLHPQEGRLADTIRRNGYDDDEFAAVGFGLSSAKTISAPLIDEAFINIECTLEDMRDLSGAGMTAMVTGRVRHVSVDEKYARGYELRCGGDGFMLLVPAPQDLTTGEPGRSAIANLDIKFFD